MGLAAFDRSRGIPPEIDHPIESVNSTRNRGVEDALSIAIASASCYRLANRDGYAPLSPQRPRRTLGRPDGTAEQDGVVDHVWLRVIKFSHVISNI